MNGRRAALCAVLLTLATAAAAAPPRPTEEFFLVSSLDRAHERLVLKRPTEVTLLMQVTKETVYQDEAGRRLALADLRTGDTVYITYRPARPLGAAAGAPTALVVRRGPMTVQELARRYGIPKTPQ